MLRDFLLENQTEILAMTEGKSLELAGVRPSSDLLKRGLPIFFEQLNQILLLEESSEQINPKDTAKMVKAATENDEKAMAKAAGRPNEGELAKSAGAHGAELMRLGYTLSYAVHAYGSMCQSITELAAKNAVTISPKEFHDLNRCLDVAIAGAVTEFQLQKNVENENKEVEHLGFLAHELRNSLMTINFSIKMIKKGTVGFTGNTGKILDESLTRMQNLIDQSLTEVRLRVDPKPHPEVFNLNQMVNQIFITAEVEARIKEQIIRVSIDPGMTMETDHQFLYSALSNLIQNALKYTRVGGNIEIRSHLEGSDVIIEVEDECGGLTDAAANLFKPFVQLNENKSGLGLGLTIAQKGIKLNNGKLEVKNLPKKGCIFKIALPRGDVKSGLR